MKQHITPGYYRDIFCLGLIVDTERGVFLPARERYAEECERSNMLLQKAAAERWPNHLNDYRLKNYL